MVPNAIGRAVGRANARLRRVLSAAGLLALAVAVAAPVAIGAAEDRPSEIPYETTTEVPLLDPSYRMSSHKVVLITDQALNPRLVNLDSGQLVAWISYSGWPSTVVFERETAKNMICHSLVNFQIKDDEIRSQPIHAGEFASFCQLKPGRYKYKIVRTDNPATGAAPRKLLEGEIIVAAEGAKK
jgi:hypothetical protein